jgi:multiple sugar transport system substrate-binding protein
MTMNRQPSRVTRRTFAAGGLGAATTALLPRFRPIGVAAQETVDLNFHIWQYGVETVQDNITRFEDLYPGIRVTLSDVPWNSYREATVNRLRSNTPTDVIYNGGDWLEEFATAGWVVPLEDHVEWVTDYQDKVFEFAWQDMTFQGKVYGLPYYADTITFMYNEQVLEDAGITAPPETWEEVTEQCLTLKEQGMEFPYLYVLAHDLPTVSEAFVSTVFGRGGELIDENNEPLWTDPESPAAQQFRWFADARNVDNILTFVSSETDAVGAMSTGQHAFVVFYNYHLAELNDPARSDLAGQFKISLMPGETHECYGFAKFYNLTQMAVDRGPEVVDAAAQFIQYFAGEIDGEFPIAKRWAVENGLGFGTRPLFDDPDVRNAFSQWIDLDMWTEQLNLARAQRHTPWQGIWNEFFRLEHVKAVAGETSVEDALQASADSWNELQERFGG